METDYVLGFEEVVADAMETMLTDGNLVEKLAKLKKQDKTIWQKIKDFIDNWAAKIREAYEGLSPDSTEGRMVAEMVDSIDQLQQLFAEGLVEVSENYQVSHTYDGALQTNTEENIKYSKRNFDEQVDEVLQSKFDRTNAVYVGMTPSILESVGLNGNLPMLTTAHHIRAAVKPKNTQKHQHGLTEKQVKSLPAKISNPVMVLDAKKVESNSIVVVTDILDPDNSPVIVTIKADGKGMYNNVEIDTNFVTSYYGRDGFARFIKNNVDADNFLYIDREKATDLSAESNTQWIEQLKNYDFDTIIRTTRANVKKYSARDTESVSNRSLLANALESAAVNDIERKRLQEYKAKIEEVQAEEEKLRELNLLLNAENDLKRMRQIQLEAKQTANRITIFDKQLLRLEATRPLQDVLKREQKAAYDRGVQKGKENMED